MSRSDRYDRLHTLFNQARELKEVDRERFLESHCGNDIDLRRELEVLLSKDQSSVLHLADDSGICRDEVEPPPEIAGYHLKELLGRGGMGQVWRATQASTQRDVALKVLPLSGWQSIESRDRFRREAQLAARITHPNVAQIFESGIDGDSAYVAMELVDGTDLRSYVAREHPNEPALVEIMVSVCRAVENAHHRGVIHRDLKPSNILVTDAARPVLVDFGVATSRLQETETPTLTTQGIVPGTPAYMSPEQASGKNEQVDTRSDVYSLGVILYRLCVGQHPYKLSGSPLEVIHRILNERIKRPRDIKHELDADLEAIILKAMSRDPDARYGTAGELAQDLESYLRQRPVSARRLSLSYVGAMYLRRHRLQVAGIAAFLLLSVGSIVGYVLVSKGHEREALELAEAAESRRHEAVLAKQEADRVSHINLLQRAVDELTHFRHRRAERLLLEVDPVRRGWAWRHLMARAVPSDPCLWKSTPFHDNIRRLTFSPSGDRIAIALARSTTAAAKDSRITILESESGRMVSELLGHEDGVFAISFTPDGKQLLSASRDGTLRRWDVHTGNELEVVASRIPADDREVTILPFEIKFSPNDQWLAMAAYPAGLFLVELEGEITWAKILGRMRCVVPLSGEDDWCEFTTDSRRLFWTTRVWQGNAGHLFELNVESGEVLRHREFASGDPVYAIDLAPDNESFLLARGRQTVTHVDNETWGTLSWFRGHRGSVRRAFFLPDGKGVVSLANDEAVRLWDVTERDTTAVLYLERRAVGSDLALDPRGRWLAVSHAQPEKRVRMFDLSAVERDQNTVVIHQDKVRAMTSSSDGKWIATAGDDGAVKLTNIESRTQKWHRNDGYEFATAVHFSTDGREVLVGRSRHPDRHPPPHGQVLRLDAETGESIDDPIEVPGWIWDLAVSPCGNKLAVAMGVSTNDLERSGSFQVLEWPSGVVVGSHSMTGPRCRDVSWAPDSRRIASVSEGELSIWDTESGNRLHQNLAAERGRNFVRFIEDGDSVLTATSKAVEIWSTQPLRRVRSFEQSHLTDDQLLQSNLGDALITPDGKQLIGASWNQSITIWNAETGNAVLSFPAHDAGVHGIEISTDGTRLLSFGHDGRVRSWAAGF